MLPSWNPYMLSNHSTGITKTTQKQKTPTNQQTKEEKTQISKKITGNNKQNIWLTGRLNETSICKARAQKQQNREQPPFTEGGGNVYKLLINGELPAGGRRGKRTGCIQP